VSRLGAVGDKGKDVLDRSVAPKVEHDAFRSSFIERFNAAGENQKVTGL